MTICTSSPLSYLGIKIPEYVNSDVIFTKSPTSTLLEIKKSRILPLYPFSSDINENLCKYLFKLNVSWIVNYSFERYALLVWNFP